MNKQRHRRRTQGGTSPETTHQTGSGVAHFSVSEVVQFSMSVDILNGLACIFLFRLLQDIVIGIVA
jgi:hypothetical protein